MDSVHRALAVHEIPNLAAYREGGGGQALVAVRAVDPDALIGVIADSDLRGRGGAGFPSARKWRTVAANRTPSLPSTVVVNAAEGEPGAFKDRTILRRDPYRVLEGALIAAHAVGATQVIVAIKRSFRREAARLRGAIAELEAAEWTRNIGVALFQGPREYLYGEETALLECIDGRHPFPRIAPPYRRGVLEVVDHRAALTSQSKSAAHVEMAGPGLGTVAPPTLVNNVETIANVPGIVREGPEWFRRVGTEQSPGTIVCTITGATARHGVGEFAMGTPLREVIDVLGGGPRRGHAIAAVMSGVANPLLPADRLDTPVSYEGMQAVGSGLGAAGFIVFDDTTDLAAVAAGVSRFLAVESCGQCTPCKRDGLIVADLLAELVSSGGDDRDLAELDRRLELVTRGARCYLASQHQVVVRSVLDLFPEAVRAHVGPGGGDATRELIAPIVDIIDGRALLDLHEAEKQPDWTFSPRRSGKAPADRLDDHRAHLAI